MFEHYLYALILCIVGLIIITLTLIFLLVNSKKIKEDLGSIRYHIGRLESAQKGNTDSVLKKIKDLQSTLLSDSGNNRREYLATINSSNDRISCRIDALNTLTSHIETRTKDLDIQIRAAQSSIEKNAKQDMYKANKNIDSTRSEVLNTIKVLDDSLRRFHENIGQKQIAALHGSENNIQKVLSKVQLNEEGISGRMDIMNATWERHLKTLAPFEKTLSQIEQLYERLLSEEMKITKQEESINSLVERHVKIVELTDKLNNTTKDVFDLMRVYLMNSVVEYTSKTNEHKPNFFLK